MRGVYHQRGGGNVPTNERREKKNEGGEGGKEIRGRNKERRRGRNKERRRAIKLITGSVI